ncbi:hypothetical protein CY34DRAFT_810588 [Suillus luteus UH-Slu-Lm8-n1]|uniref:Uncharacterized protein n=1 Tax=Suillus luteus UH-Slu-Lm8-n1 TaxID=930992 RepID=A0A0D0AGC4_9AGAM|nr:hypothetical protein CY34DRAFT_810588 [Suillus luteus UH-Slu-Lm8-n1]
MPGEYIVLVAYINISLDCVFALNQCLPLLAREDYLPLSPACIASQPHVYPVPAKHRARQPHQPHHGGLVFVRARSFMYIL